MTEELDVLRIIGEGLRAADVPFMLTGSFALGYYGKPRMTRGLDFVVAHMERLIFRGHPICPKPATTAAHDTRHSY